MDGELTEYGANDIDVEDIGLRAFFGEAFDRLRGRGRGRVSRICEGGRGGNIPLL